MQLTNALQQFHHRKLARHLVMDATTAVLSPATRENTSICTHGFVARHRVCTDMAPSKPLSIMVRHGTMAVLGGSNATSVFTRAQVNFYTAATLVALAGGSPG